MYGVSRRMYYVHVTYVWRIKCTRDVSTAYVLRFILICGVSVLYHLFVFFFKSMRTNGCVHFVDTNRTFLIYCYQLLESKVELDATGEIWII